MRPKPHNPSNLNHPYKLAEVCLPLETETPSVSTGAFRRNDTGVSRFELPSDAIGVDVENNSEP